VRAAAEARVDGMDAFPQVSGGLECVAIVDDRAAAVCCSGTHLATRADPSSNIFAQPIISAAS
jgi:hypothetical protein